MSESSREKFPLIEASDIAPCNIPTEVHRQYGTQNIDANFESDEDDDMETPGAPMDDRLESVLFSLVLS